MNTKIIRNVFDRHIRPTRELDRFLFKLPAELSSLMRLANQPALLARQVRSYSYHSLLDRRHPVTLRGDHPGSQVIKLTNGC